MSDLSIPKRIATAHIRLVGGTSRDVDIYLSETAEHHRGPERPSDVVRRSTRFVPVHDHKVGFMAMNVGSILCMTVPLSTELGDGLPAEDLAGSMSTSVDVEFVLTDGSSVSGTLVYLQPHGRQRLQDFLAEAPPFVVLREDESAHVINLDQVCTVVPRSAESSS